MLRETKATFVELLVLARSTTTYNTTTATTITNDSYVSGMVAPSSQSDKNSDDDDEDDDDDSEEADGASKKKFESSKLIADCYDENNYVVYYRNLKLYLRLGLKVTLFIELQHFNRKSGSSRTFC